MAISDPLIPALMTVPVLVGLQIALAPRYAVAKLCGTRVSANLTQEEVEAITHWYETESLDRLPVGETLYNLAPRVQP